MPNSKKVKMAFYEVEGWEQEYLAGQFAEHDLRFFDYRLDESTVNQAADVDILSVFIHSQVSHRLLAAMPNLKLIATRSTGFDHIDLEMCNQSGIVVSNVPRYGENTVAEHTFGLILSLSRNIHKAYLRTSRGDYSLEGLEGFDLKGRTLGVVGAGSIGLHVVRIAKGFDMNVLAYDPMPNRLIAEVLGFSYVSLDDLFARSDIITLHAPYTPGTYHLINRDTLKLVKHGALLINTARGALVDTDALVWALDEGILGGAGLDVLEGEELITEEKQLLSQPATEEKLRMILRQHFLWRRPDVVITPHIAFYSREALERIVEITAVNIKEFLAGNPQNVINLPSITKRAA